MRALIEASRAAISDAVLRHKGRSVAIFGSVARGEATADSDIDFLVDFAACEWWRRTQACRDPEACHTIADLVGRGRGAFDSDPAVRRTIVTTDVPALLDSLGA